MRMVLFVALASMQCFILAHAGEHAMRGVEHSAQQQPLAERCTDMSTLPSPDCGQTPSAAFDRHGQLWVSFASHGHVYVTRSKDNGETFAPPVVVNRRAESLYADGENRPKIAFGPKDEVYVSWTRKIPGMYAGAIRFARSDDNGEHFDTPLTVNDDSAPISHRFDALAVGSRGTVYIAWLDKRDQAASRSAGGEYPGAALYYAVSRDGGRQFDFNRKVADNSCECCRVAMAVGEDDEVVVLWRHIFDDHVRDHALVTLGPKAPGAVARVTDDGWRTEVCPHHGPDLSLQQAGRVHMTWFSRGTRNQGLMYGRYDTRRGVLDVERSLDNSAGASHPQVLVQDGRVYAVWKAFTGEHTELRLAQSDDNGDNWRATRTLAVTGDDSDHPLLLSNAGRVYVSWLTREEGYRVLPVPDPGAVVVKRDD